MSLNWNVSKIENHEEVCFIEASADEPNHGITKGDRLLNPLTNAFIWKSMVTGLGKGWSLDADFAPEFYSRIKLLEKLDGPLVFGGQYGDKYEVTYEDVQRHIGLSVNVSPVSRAAFIKNAITVELDAGVRLYERAIKQAVAA